VFTALFPSLKARLEIMQSAKQKPSFSSIYVNAPVYVNPSATEVKERREMDRSFAIACTLGFVTVVFGFAALIYQFVPEFNKFRANTIQGEAPQTSSFYS
jgi:hypothetical protein